MDRDPNGKLFIVRRVTTYEDGTPRKRPVWERDGRIYKTLKEAKGESDLDLFYQTFMGSQNDRNNLSLNLFGCGICVPVHSCMGIFHFIKKEITPCL